MAELPQETINNFIKAGYQQGREDALQYIIDRGQSLLESDSVTSDIAMGICLMMGIARADKEQKHD